jgi:hypothetical protein
LGALHVTTEWVFAFEVAFTVNGALGSVPSCTDAEAIDTALVPAALVAVIVKV